MAPSQNIMMRINSLGTTTFCWRPSQGSANAPPPQTLSISPPPLPSSSLTWVFVPCHPLMGSSTAVAAYHPSLGLLRRPRSHRSPTLPPSSPLSLCALVKISTVSGSTSSPTSSSLLLPVPSSPLCSLASSLLPPPSLPLLLPLPPHGTGYG